MDEIFWFGNFHHISHNEYIVTEISKVNIIITRLYFLHCYYYTQNFVCRDKKKFENLNLSSVNCKIPSLIFSLKMNSKNIQFWISGFYIFFVWIYEKSQKIAENRRPCVFFSSLIFSLIINFMKNRRKSQKIADFFDFSIITF